MADSAFSATTIAALQSHLNDTSDAHDASAISSVAAGNLSSTDVQAALNELDTEKQPLDSDLTVIAGLADPNADRILFWDDSAGAYAYLSPGTGLTLSGTTISVDQPWTGVTKAADESVASSTTPQNDDELFFTAVSGAFYEIELCLIYGSPAGGGTPDMKFALGEDATNRGIFDPDQIWGTNDTPARASIMNADQTATTGVGTATTDRAVIVRGHYRGNGGTFRLLWAQNTSGANATIMRAGSVLRYRRIV